MSKNRFLLGAMALGILSIVMVNFASADVEFLEMKELNIISVCDERDQTCIGVADMNLGATTNSVNDLTSWGYTYQWGNNTPFPIGCKSNECNDGVTSNSTDVLAVWSNKYNNVGYTLGTNFVKHNPDYWQYEISHDGLWGGADDNAENQWGLDLSGLYDVYDIDLVRQGPCDTGFHVPSLGEWLELSKLLSQNNENFSIFNFPKQVVYRDISGKIRMTSDENPMFWTSSPSGNKGTAMAVTKNGDPVEVERSRGLQIRCFRNKRDAMVGVGLGDDTVFYDTVVPVIIKKTGNLQLLNYSGEYMEIKQQIELSDKNNGPEKSFLFLGACRELQKSKISFKGFKGKGLGIDCDVNLFTPWGSPNLYVYITGYIDIADTELMNCTQIKWNGDNIISIKIQDEFVGDFSRNQSESIEIQSDYIYAPTKGKDGETTLWNYIYTGVNYMKKLQDGDNFQLNDDDFIRGWDFILLSAEPLNSNDIECVIVSGTDGLSPICNVKSYLELHDYAIGIIHSCGEKGCENECIERGTNCWWNSDKYEEIQVPLKYKNIVNLRLTGNTYSLKSGDTWDVMVKLKNNPGTSCYSMDNGTDSTYLKIQFKKIISPYKAGYLSGDDGGVRYTTANLGEALREGGGATAFTWYLSNSQTQKSGRMEGGTLGKVNYDITASTEIAAENFTVEGESQVGNYEWKISIQKPTSSNTESPDAYKFALPGYGD